MKSWNILSSLFLFFSTQTLATSPHILNLDVETRNKIVVLDTGVDLTVLNNYKEYFCKGEHYDSTDTTINDTHGHGTNITGIIISYINPKKSCVLIVKYTQGKHQSKLSNLIDSLEVINKLDGVKIVNFSSGGGGKYSTEKSLIEQLIKRSIYFITASGNGGIDLSQVCDQYPACYLFLNIFFRVVANGTDPKHRYPSSNYNGPVTDWRNGKEIKGFNLTMTGTSQSTAILSGEIAKSLEK